MMSNLAGLSKKQPSLRRLNQLMLPEQRLAPLFENSITNSSHSNSENAANDTMNSHLLLLRKSIANNNNPNSSNYDSYHILNSPPKENNDKSNIDDIYRQNSILAIATTNKTDDVNAKKISNSTLNFTSINELEKKASAIIGKKFHGSSEKLETNSTGNESRMINFKNKLNEMINSNSQLNKSNEIQLKDIKHEAKIDTSPKSVNSDASSNETDSGRHSLSDSPSYLLTAANADNQNLSLFQVTPRSSTHSSNNKKVINKNNNTNKSAGTFTSKCTLSSGTAITIAQTLQKLQQNQQQKQQVITRNETTKKPNLNLRSASREHVVRSPLYNSSLASRSHSSGRIASNTNNNNVKNSNCSINRNCSEL